MASTLQRLARRSHQAYRSTLAPISSRTFSTDSVMETFKPGEIGLVSGIPDEHLTRKVLILSPARSATQQGSGKVGKWKINFMSNQKYELKQQFTAKVYGFLSIAAGNLFPTACVSASLWENPLMGWTSTGDPYAHVGESALYFDSEEAAREFAERHGWDFTVKKRHTPLLKARAYADNFKWKGPPTEQN